MQGGLVPPKSNRLNNKRFIVQNIEELRMKKINITLLALLFLTNVHGQKMEKTYLDEKDSTSNCYTTIYPSELPWTGFLFLIPGLGQKAEDVLIQTDLPKLASQNGILVIIPTFKTGVLSFGVDSLSQQSFKDILIDVTNKHKLLDQRLFVGGFSIGGSCAIKFAELASSEKYKIKPAAVFAIDPPLDFERFYYSRKRDMRLSAPAKPSEEAVFMIDKIEKEMKGNPETARANFYKISPYSFSDVNQTAIKTLLKTPLRIYTEPDVNWWIKERGGDFSGMNALDASAMINELIKLGHKNASLITTDKKGFRKPENRRHPHSWSIVDNPELIKWMLSQK